MYQRPYMGMSRPVRYPNYNDRFAGGFAVPFLLGGLTGGLLAPAFYPRPYPVYNYPPYPMYYR